ncbi:redoxin [Leptolyngbya boryana NIES-2135]|jgi:peroxiredoxin|uniref:Redoxin n=1 Tax=Leptolyngbya boryana NIES-2135 TaxID=1973484 RepID=A0A1Z4J9Q2_LEPBY|nr:MULTISPECIES: redoxin domain-containing protein [Leptolyngbya]BAY53460.1 redoxin [Leptolyngbya boryana NIES-2135]MBD2366676.1 redoxin domain-containing protein [Leptolyngbya sp. FACHB-161]MBD2373310.1 redoxin domain-containing protein [Leptolyngbya sp. FACHB-238]MBD2397710.1 redoxin domain-containing protein [Leptolyngbya sp. FACHB-239]MBD2404854.1 redoxin domain-containing protein [Leptolyngbya sp. FACHB-402]
MLTSTDFSGLINPRFFQNFMPVPATNSLALGQATPEFDLPDIKNARRVKLSDYRNDRPVLLAFTRIFTEKQYCPFCFPHIKALNEQYQEFSDRQVEILMITSTDEQQSKKVVEDLGLQFPLLSDSSCKTFRRYQTGQALGAPLPAQFLIDRQGILRYKHLFSFLDHNASVETLLSAIDQLS